MNDDIETGACVQLRDEGAPPGVRPEPGSCLLVDPVVSGVKAA
jgi:hypothetical protein